jgi:uncharacterized protein (DUF58 family)
MFIAVGIPMITTSFWVLVLYALFYPHTDMRWFVLALAGSLVLVFLIHLLAGRLVPAPIRAGQTHPPPLAICNPIATRAKEIFSNSVPQPF